MMSIRTYTDKRASVSCVYPDIVAVPSHFFVSLFGLAKLFLRLNRSYKSNHHIFTFCRMADQSIIRSAAQSFAVLSYNDTPIYPTPSDPLDPPEQPQPPEQNDGAGDVEENAPPSPQDETMRKARKDRAPNKKAIAIAEHVRKWLTEQVEQERKEFEAIWLGKGDVLSSSDDARNLTETIVAKTGFVVPAGDVRAWLTAFTGLPRALDWIYKHDHRTPQPTSDSPPAPEQPQRRSRHRRHHRCSRARPRSLCWSSRRH